MKPPKPKAQLPKLMTGFVNDLQAKWAERGKDILDKVCDDAPAKIVDTLGKLAVAERLAPEEKIDFNEAKNMREIGVKLLQSIGFREPDEDSIQLAIQANNDFIMTLKRIHQCAQASPEDEIH